MLASLPAAERAAWLGRLNEPESRTYLYDWRRFWARPSQVPPPGDWRVWLVLAGRGFGKTRTGAEWVRERVESGAYGRVALVAPTAADVRDVIVEGESGILAISPPWNRPEYEPSKRRLTWSNGAQATTYSADEPDRLRGPQHDGAWADEIASWRHPETWDMLMFGLRLGADPRAVATTTPKPVRLVRDLLAATTTTITRGATYENAANLAPAFLEQITAKYAGTRLGRQELDAELLDDVPGALWTRTSLDDLRVSEHPDLARVVVAVDPAVTSGEDADETGIVVAGLGVDGHGYVLADLTCRLTPDGWARRAVNAYHARSADRLVAEVNNGGDLVERVIRTVDRDVSYKAVTASRGKRTRAEPVAALYEQGKVHHAGGFADLEDQMCLAEGTCVATWHGDLPIEMVLPGDMAWTRAGWRSVTWAGRTGTKPTATLTTACGRTLRATPDHPVYVVGRGFVPLREVQKGDKMPMCQHQSSTRTSPSVASGTSATRATGTTRPVGLVDADCSTATSGSRSTALFLPDGTSTIATPTAGTTSPLTCRPFLPVSTSGPTSQPASLSRMLARAATALWRGGRAGSRRSSDAPSAGARWSPEACGHGSAECTVASVTAPHRRPEAVYNLTVDDRPEFFANGLLVHNCTYVPDAYDGSPDRVDALVWALTELMLLRRGWGAA